MQSPEGPLQLHSVDPFADRIVHTIDACTLASGTEFTVRSNFSALTFLSKGVPGQPSSNVIECLESSDICAAAIFEVETEFVLSAVGTPCEPKPTVLLTLDDDTIDNGTNCSDMDLVPVNDGGTCSSIEECAFFSCPDAALDPIENDPSFLVNDDVASVPGAGGNCPNVLRINTIAPPAVPLWLPTGEVGDEGLFSPATGAFANIPGGFPGYIGCDPAQDEHFLDGIAGAPLDAAAIFALEGRRVCAVVHDSDISDLGSSQLNAMGSRNGRTAFDVIRVEAHPKGETLLPIMLVDFLDSQDGVDAACACENLATIDGDPYDCPPVP